MNGNATRLYPLPPLGISAAKIYEDIELPPAGRSESSRPYVIINMVSTLDGRVAVEGKSASLGSQVDRRTMRNLRAKADAVMIGANTLRAEKLSLGVDAPRHGRQPLAVIVTRSGDIPLESNLLLTENQELLVVSPPDVAVELPRSIGRILSVPQAPPGEGGYIDLRETLNVLKAEFLIDLLVVEGGSTINYQLISRGLADELFLTLAPKVIGEFGSGNLTAVTGVSPPPEASSPDLLSVTLAGDELFLRYGLIPPSQNAT